MNDAHLRRRSALQEIPTACGLGMTSFLLLFRKSVSRETLSFGGFGGVLGGGVVLALGNRLVGGLQQLQAAKDTGQH